MAKSQRRSKKKPSGSSYKKDRKKRKRELSREPGLTRVSKNKRVKKIRTLGGNNKMRALRMNKAIITNDKKVKEAEIVRVLKNPANRHFVRMNVITKGAIIETKKGKVEVTNRPGQEGQVQGILIKD